jgi:hypothetical protein
MGGIRVIDACFLANWLLFLRFLFGLAFVSILRMTYSPFGDPITYNGKGPRRPQFQRYALECPEVCLLDSSASKSVGPVLCGAIISSGDPVAGNLKLLEYGYNRVNT